MATLTLQNWHANDDGTPRAGATVVYKVASTAEPNGNPVLGTTTTNASGEWQFTGVPDGDYDVYLTDGVTVRFWKGLAALPLTFARAPVGPVTNALVNGDFTVWQRGTSFVSPATGTYTADRWQWGTSGAGAVTITRDTDVPAVGANAINTPYSLKVDVTTADASLAATDLYLVQNGIEGFDYRPLTNGFACSFWVKAAKTGIHCVAFTNRGADRTYVAEYTVSAANTWEYKTVTVSAPPTAGTWSYTTGAGLFVEFPLAAGSNFQGSAGAWQSSGAVTTAAAVNELDNTANNFFVALVNVIPGSTAAPLVPLPAAVQLARCQRYYEVLQDASHAAVGLGQCVSTTQGRVLRAFAVEKGGTPTVNIVSATNFTLRTSTNANQAVTALTAPSVQPNMVELSATVASGLTAGDATQLWGAVSSLSIEWNPA